MQNDTVLIDRLEDELIDHPDASTRQQLSGETLDEAFQKKLNARAEQIANHNDIFTDVDDTTDQTNRGSTSQGPPVHIKNRIIYEKIEVETFETQISEWFVSHDYDVLSLSLLAEFAVPSKEIEEYLKAIGSKNLEDNIRTWRAILYYALGEYIGCTRTNEQIEAMERNLIQLHKFGFTLVVCLQFKILTNKNEKDSNDVILLIVSTLLYLMIILGLHANEDYREQILNTMDEHDILTHLFSYLAKRRVVGAHQHRLKNIIKIIKDLMILQFGTTDHMNATKIFLDSHHGIRPSSLSLTCSPLQYFTIRENLMDKYPLYSLLQANRSPLVEGHYNTFMAANAFSNSLSNLLENPRPNRAHTAQSQLPAQTVHIATPVPTPPSVNSEFMSGGEKIRKLYQINQGMPFIFPTDNATTVPYAVEEAYNIFSEAVKEDLSSGQFWDERQRFMVQERGFEETSVEEPEKYRYTTALLEQYPDKRSEIESLLRVESFYHDNLADLNDVVQLFVELISVSKIEYPLMFAEHELNRILLGQLHYDEVSLSKFSLQVQNEVEIVAAKETLLKSMCAIIHILLSWFKVSHVLKCHHLTSVLYDLQYLEVFHDFLNNCFDNPNIQIQLESKGNNAVWVYQNRLLNPQIHLPDFDFFEICLKSRKSIHRFHFINDDLVDDIPIDLVTNERMLTSHNHNACTILDYMLQICDEILIENMSQRVFVLNELKPTDVLKAIVTNYENERLIAPILRILKKLVPYQGRKWKASNMDLISTIYLRCDLDLKDDWLSGKDLESDFNTAYEQEVALRGLLQFFNKRLYPDQMAVLGYSPSKIPRLDVEFDDSYI